MLARPGLLLGRGAAFLGRRVLAPGALASPFTLSRTQAGGALATGLAADGATWVEYAADVPRWVGSARRLLTEGQRTNLLANARTVGGTGWTNTNIASASPSAGPDGQPASALTLNEGTGTGQHATGHAAVSVTSGTSYTASFLVKAGSCQNVQIAFASGAFGANAWQNFVLSGAGAVGTAGAAVSRARIVRTGDFYLISATAPATSTTTGAADLHMGQASSDTRAPSYTGTSRDVTVSWAQLEAAGFGSTIVLPPSGSPAAATRGADVVGASLASLGIAANGACAVLWAGLIPQVSSTGVNLSIVVLDDGTVTNRILAWNPSTTSNIAFRRDNSGSSASQQASMPVNTPFALGMSMDGAGQVLGSRNGAAALTLTGAPASGLTTLRLGSRASAGDAMYGETSGLWLAPPMPAAALAAAVGRLPLS